MSDRQKRVLKWSVDVASIEPHLIGAGPVVLVASQSDPAVVNVWTEELIPRRPSTRTVRVYGTGHAAPGHAKHLGSCVAAGGSLVWHVYDVTPTKLRS